MATVRRRRSAKCRRCSAQVGGPTTRSSFPGRSRDCGGSLLRAGSPRSSRRRTSKRESSSTCCRRSFPAVSAVIFTVTHTPLPTWEDTEIVAQSLATGERKVLVERAADGRYLPSGHLVYIRRGALMAIPFDLDRLEAKGGAVALIANVMQAANQTSEQFETGAGQFSVSASGALLYLPGGIFPDPERSLVWVDRATGAVQTLPRAHEGVSVASNLARRPASRRLDTRRPEHLAARSLARHADAADVRAEERPGNLDAGWQERDLRIGGRRQ